MLEPGSLRLGSLEHFALLGLERGASDLCLCSGLPPLMTILGNLLSSEFERLAAADIWSLVRRYLTPKDEGAYRECGQVTVAFRVEGRVSGRMHLVSQRAACQAHLRLHPWTLPRLPNLGLDSPHPWTQGLWVVAGEGRSTLQAAIGAHLLAAEGLQLRVGQACPEWYWPAREGLGDRLRLMDDLDTPMRLKQALEHLEQGETVLATHRSNGSREVLEAMEHGLSRPRWERLLGHWRGLICQRLVPDVSGRALVGVHEILLNSEGLAARLVLDGKQIQLDNLMATGWEKGMKRFDQDLAEAVAQGRILAEDALEYCDSEAYLKDLLQRG